MGSAFHQLCPRYSGTLTFTAPTAIRLWETFTFLQNSALERVFDDNQGVIFLILIKTICCYKMIQMGGHNIRFCA